jgi:hypothetical protein
MKIEKKNRNDERKILTSLIVDKKVLSRVCGKSLTNPFKARWSNLIYKWCIKYYQKYEDAPMKDIEGLYEDWATEATDDKLVGLVEKFLGGLSEEYEELQKDSNSDYIIDMAGRYFNRVRMEDLTEEVDSLLEAGRGAEAEELITTFHKVDLGTGEVQNVLEDKSLFDEMYTTTAETLIKYPGDLGKFFDDTLARDSFVAFLAPEKRGKSFWLQDMAIRAVAQGRKVMYFEAGDMSKPQVMRRLVSRIAGRPFKGAKLHIPVGMGWVEEEKIPTVRYKKKRFTGKMPKKDAKEAVRRLLDKTKLKSRVPLFKISAHPNSSLAVEDIKGILNDLQNQESWNPDVIIIDYADILDMDRGGFEGRDRYNEVWKRLRSLSQQLHCLVVTATQADAQSYTEKVVRRSNFSEDKRKLAHVTACYGINQIEEEKTRGLMRLNYIARREGEYSEGKCIWCASCLGIGNPAKKSCW